MDKKNPRWTNSASPAKAAHVLAKVLGGAAALGAGAWGLRHLMHAVKLDALNTAGTSATAGKSLSKLYKRPT